MAVWRKCIVHRFIRPAKLPSLCSSSAVTAQYMYNIMLRGPESSELRFTDRRTQYFATMSSEPTMTAEPTAITIGSYVGAVQEILCSENELEHAQEELLTTDVPGDSQTALEDLPVTVHRLSVVLTPIPTIFMKEEASGRTVQVTCTDCSRVNSIIGTVRVYRDTNSYDSFYSPVSCMYIGRDHTTITIAGKKEAGLPQGFIPRAVDEL